MTKILSKLATIQAELKAPKSQFNKFGGYSYRKAEDILEAVKPHLQKEGCILTCDDTLLLVGSRYYIKSTATLTCIEDGSAISTSGYAREEEEKKGMDGSQVTGASSSYARKYALNGLFAIDDNQDSDTSNQGDRAPKTTPKTTPKTAPKVATPANPAPAPVQTAPAAPAPKVQDLTPRTVSSLSKTAYDAWVKAAAEGKTTKNGLPAMKDFIRTYNPTSEELQKFNDDVFNYMTTHPEK